MVSVNDINYYSAAEIMAALERETKGTGRGAFRPDEIPGLVVDALSKLARTVDRRDVVTVNCQR
jgi:hypothetical protein